MMGEAELNRAQRLQGPSHAFGILTPQIPVNASLYFWSSRVLDLPSLNRGAKMAVETKYQGVYPGMVTKIIASYVSHHNVAPEQIPDLINSVHRTINSLGKPAEPQCVALTPALPYPRSWQ